MTTQTDQPHYSFRIVRINSERPGVPLSLRSFGGVQLKEPVPLPENALIQTEINVSMTVETAEKFFGALVPGDRVANYLIVFPDSNRDSRPPLALYPDELYAQFESMAEEWLWLDESLPEWGGAELRTEHDLSTGEAAQLLGLLAKCAVYNAGYIPGLSEDIGDGPFNFDFNRIVEFGGQLGISSDLLFHLEPPEVA